MKIGKRLRELREEKNLSQTDLEKLTGLLRFHISRLENGHDIPKIETLRKIAVAFKMPFYQLFFEGEGTLNPLPLRNLAADGTPYERKLRRLVHAMDDSDRQILLCLVQKLANR